MTVTPSMQDERNRIEAENASLRATIALLEEDCERYGKSLARAHAENDKQRLHIASVEVKLSNAAATIASLFDENRVLRGRLALMDEAFMDNHGCFPLDRTNEHEMLWNDACLACREITGDDYQARAVTAVRAREEFLAAASLSTRKGG